MKPLFTPCSLSVALVCFLASPVALAQDSWSDRISLKGDIRLRHESFKVDNAEDRARFRFRARLGLTGQVTDNVKVVFSLASGADNPVSRNVSFDGGFSTKDFGLELAYVDWSINENLSLYGGKMKNPLFRVGGAPHIWDSDLNPEGFALKYEAGGLFATAGGFTVEERSSGDDSFLYALQVGYKFPIGENSSLTAGASYFGYTNTVGNSPFFLDSGLGNTTDADGNYVYDYRNYEGFAQFDTRLGGWPFQIFAGITQNTEVSVQDTAMAFGAKVGSAKNRGDWEFAWKYMDVEADSVIAMFNDSDFGGGTTASDGHIIQAKYSAGKTIFLGATLFVNQINKFVGPELDFNRLQLDVEFKFN